MARAQQAGIERSRNEMGEDPWSSALVQRLEDASVATQNRRLPMQTMQQNALAQTLQAGQPMNAALGQMYGGNAMFDTHASNPVAAGAIDMRFADPMAGGTAGGNPGEYSGVPDPQLGRQGTPAYQRRQERQQRRQERRAR